MTYTVHGICYGQIPVNCGCQITSIVDILWENGCDMIRMKRLQEGSKI